MWESGNHARTAKSLAYVEGAMPRIDKSMLKGLTEVNGLHAERAISSQEVEVAVLDDVTVFTRHVVATHHALAYRWSLDHVGLQPPVTDEEATRYAISAARTRVARVNNERFDLRCDDRWCLPAQIAVPINGVGRVTMERKIVNIKPIWNTALDTQLLTRNQWFDISQRLRAMTDYPGSKTVMVDALAGEKSGDEVLMSLIPVRDEHGAITILRSEYDIDAIAAASYLIMGLNPRALDGVVLPDHPLLISPSYIRVAGVLQYLDYLAEVGT